MGTEPPPPGIGPRRLERRLAIIVGVFGLLYTLQTADSLPHQPKSAALQRDTSFVQSLIVLSCFLVLHVAVLLAAPPSAH